MAKSSNNILALGVGLNLDPLNQDIANAAKTAKEGMGVIGQSVVDGGAKASGATEKLGDKVQTMRQQLRLATQDAQAMAVKYGIMSTQAIASASRAGELKDKIGDINTVITAFSADSKFTVVAGALQSAAGAASIVTGAMGLLGTESKATQEMLLKVQSALALTQGLAQIKEMGASFTALRAVIVGQVIPSIAAMGVELIIATGGAVLVLAAIAYAVNDYSVNLQRNEQQLALNAQRERDYADSIRTSKEELIAKTRELRNELLALQQGVTVDELTLKQKEGQVQAFNALIEKNKKFNESIREENELKRKQLVIQNMASLRYISEAEYGIVQEKNNRGLETKVQLLKDEIEQGKIQLGLTKEIKTIQDASKLKPIERKYLNKVDLSVVGGLPQPELQPIAYKGAKVFDMNFELELLLAEQTTESHSERMQAINQDMWAKLKNIKEQGLNNVFGNLGEALGNTIAQSIQGENVDMFGSLRDAILISIADMAMATGTALVAAGIALMLDPMTAGFTGAATKIAAGTALIAAGSLAKGLIKGGSKGATALPIPGGGGGGGNNSNLAPNSNYIGGQNSGQLVIQGYVRGNDINFVNGKSGSKNNRNLRFG